MYPTTRRGPARGTAFMAILQMLLLLSALVLAPATAIAQETDPATGAAPAAETTGDAPAAEAAPKAAPTLSEQGLALRLYPQKIRLAKYGKAIVSAWLCPKDDKTPFGGQRKGDGKPGTKDDDCTPVRVKWSVDAADSARRAQCRARRADHGPCGADLRHRPRHRRLRRGGAHAPARTGRPDPSAQGERGRRGDRQHHEGGRDRGSRACGCRACGRRRLGRSRPVRQRRSRWDAHEL